MFRKMHPDVASPHRASDRSLATALLLAALALGACAAEPAGPRRLRAAAAASSEERLCAWFGQAAGDTLYFGQSAFWNAFAAEGGPTGDLGATGPARIGRFDLVAERLAPPLVVAASGSRSGVWDVLPLHDGRVLFTGLFDHTGAIDPETGTVARFGALGVGLNELAPAGDGRIVASRYTDAAGGDGSVLLFTTDGELLAEHPLQAGPDHRALAKTVAFDPVREEIWVTTDLEPIEAVTRDGEPGHDARILDRSGRERRRFIHPEVQFVHFGSDGEGAAVALDGEHLGLWKLPADRSGRGPARLAPASGTQASSSGPEPFAGEPDWLLDRAFAADFDYAQDIQEAPDGRLVVTRWSGWVHVVDPRVPGGPVRSVELPRAGGAGLYYTAVVRGDRVCATYCEDVSVVCATLPRVD